MNSLIRSAAATAAALAFMAISGNGVRAAEDGAVLFNKYCTQCHSAEVGHNGVGPSLAGVVDRHAAMVPGYHYSQIMKSTGLTWNETTLTKYLSSPQTLVPCHSVTIKALVQCHGIKMTFRGFRDPADSAAVVAYLKTLK